MFKGDRVSVLQDKTVPETGGGVGGTAMSMYLMPLNCTLKNDKFYVLSFSPVLKDTFFKKEEKKPPLPHKTSSCGQ